MSEFLLGVGGAVAVVVMGVVAFLMRGRDRDAETLEGNLKARLEVREATARVESLEARATADKATAEVAEVAATVTDSDDPDTPDTLDRLVDLSNRRRG